MTVLQVIGVMMLLIAGVVTVQPPLLSHRNYKLLVIMASDKTPTSTASHTSLTPSTTTYLATTPDADPKNDYASYINYVLCFAGFIVIGGSLTYYIVKSGANEVWRLEAYYTGQPNVSPRDEHVMLQRMI